MDREMASTAPISQPLQYMMVSTRHTMPAGGREVAWTWPHPYSPGGGLGKFRGSLGKAMKSTVDPAAQVTGEMRRDRAREGPERGDRGGSNMSLG